MKKKSSQSPHWVDAIAADVFKWQQQQKIGQLHVDDMKTPSGRVHTGSLVGAVLHDVVAKTVAEKSDQKTISTFVINDMDPMDGLPSYLDSKQYQPYMGVPLYKIPAPDLDSSGIDVSQATPQEINDFKKAQSFADFYALDFIHAMRKLGCTQDIVWSHQLYESGQMDQVIAMALDNVEVFRNIYQQVADYDLPPNWHPFQVVCPECGKVGTTLVTGWDGKQVTFECQPDKVTWAQGCGHSGTTSPFGGTGKLLWKVDWPAHWKVLGVTIEGAGKDHTTAGGSRDMADAICKQVFEMEPPFDIPYEWILIRGAKMSSSKGVGTSAREFTELFPKAVGRFLFVNKHYNQVLDFDPTTMSIPDLFDLFDQAARIFWKQEEGDQRLARSFELSFTDQQIVSPQFLPRFRDVALWMQHPEIDLEKQFAEIKGSQLSKPELKTLEERRIYAQIWIDRYAPVDFQFSITATTPQEAFQLSDSQKEFLSSLNTLMGQKKWQPDELQQAIFDLAKSTVGSKQGFQAIYLAFLGKKSGPRAAWLLLSIDAKLRQQRIQEIIDNENNQPKSVDNQSTEQKKSTTRSSISTAVTSKIPGMFFAEVLITDVTISKTNEQLEQLKTAVLAAKETLSTQDISQLSSVQAYRNVFKTTGTDWHKRRPSPDALLRRIALNKGLYSINTAVDAYNLAVIETGIGLGGFDADKLQLPVTLRFSEDNETMLLLGDDKPTQTRQGQLVYADQLRPVTIDLNYRDIDDTKITVTTHNIALYADGAPGISQKNVVAALQKGAEYIQQFCGGTIGTLSVIK